MKLFFSPGSCAMASHIVAKELGTKIDLEAVNLKAKTWKGGDFTKVNPKGSVPTLLLDNGEVLTEGAVIMQYLADQKPDTKLIPKAGTMERYRCQEWLNFIATDLHKTFSPLWNPKISDEVKTQFKETLTRKFEFVANHLKTNNFLMGTQYTIADAYLFTIMSWAPHVSFDLSKWPTLMGFAERVRTRPATHSTLMEEGLLK